MNDPQHDPAREALVKRVEETTAARNAVGGRAFEDRRHAELKALGRPAHWRREIIIDEVADAIVDMKLAQKALDLYDGKLQ